MMDRNGYDAFPLVCSSLRRLGAIRMLRQSVAKKGELELDMHIYF